MGRELVPVTRPVIDTEENLKLFLNAKHKAGLLVTPIEEIKSIQSKVDPAKWAILVTTMEPIPARGALRKFEAQHPTATPILKAALFALAIAVAVLAALLGLVHLITSAVSATTLRGIGGVLLILSVLVLVTARRKGHGRHDGKGWHYTDCK